MSHYSYNLIDEPWITCIRQGKNRHMGLRELLVSAHELQAITIENPLTVAALLRVLLALVHRIVDGPKKSREWKELYLSKHFPEERIDKYFDIMHDRFDLFSKTHPFYQTPGLSIINANGDPSPASVSLIMHERASGNMKTIFDHTIDDKKVKLTPAQAAKALITAQMFSLGGLNKKNTSLFGYQQSYLNAVMVSGIYIFLTGQNLFETLMLNLLLPESHLITCSTDDTPVWERDNKGGSSAKTPLGYLDFLTCKCRHIRLLPEKCCNSVTVSKIHIAQGEAFPDVTNPTFLRKKNKKTGEWTFPQLYPERMVWRDSISLFAFDTGTDYRPAAFRQAMAMHREVALPSRYLCSAIALSNKKANPLAWRKENLPVPLSLLEKPDTIQWLTAGMERAENVGLVLDGAVKTFIRNVLPENFRDVKDKADATGAMQLFWDQLEGYFHIFLSDIEEGEIALNTWFTDIGATARFALESCVRQRYADSGATLKAWVLAADELNKKLPKLKAKQGGEKSE